MCYGVGGTETVELSIYQTQVSPGRSPNFKIGGEIGASYVRLSWVTCVESYFLCISSSTSRFQKRGSGSSEVNVLMMVMIPFLGMPLGPTKTTASDKERSKRMHEIPLDIFGRGP